MNPFFENSYFRKSILFLSCIIILFIPFDFKIVEKREFKIIDKNGTALENAIVKQTWYQYSLDYTCWDESYSNREGFVILPSRRVRTTIFDIVYGAISTILEYKLHASISSSDSISVHAEGHGWRTFHDGKGLESKIVVLD